MRVNSTRARTLAHMRKLVLAVAPACSHEPARVTLPPQPASSFAASATLSATTTASTNANPVDDDPLLRHATHGSDPIPPPSNCPNITASVHATATLKQAGLVEIVVTLQTSAAGTLTTNARPAVALGTIIGNAQVTAMSATLVVKPQSGAFSVQLPLSCASGPGTLLVYASLLAGTAKIESVIGR